MSKTRTVAIIGVLALTHLAVFYAASRPSAETSTSPQAAASPAGAASGREGKSMRRTAGGGPTHAQLWQKLLEAKLSRSEFEKSRAKLLDDWAKHDLAGVLDLMLGPRSPGAGRFDPSDAIAAEIAGRRVQVLEWIRGGRFGSNRQEAYSAWFGALKRNGQVEFILASLPEASFHEKRWSLQALLGDATGPVLGGIRDSFDTWFKDNPSRAPIMDSYARRQADLAGGDASVLFDREKDPAIRDALGAAWLAKRIGYPPPVDRLREILQLPEDARGGAVSNLINYYDDAGLAAVRPALAEMNRLGLWKEMAGDAGQQTVSYLAGRSHGNPQEILDPLLAITDAGARAVLLEAAGQGMSGGKDDAQTLVKVAEAIPAGADRDACLAGMVKAIAWNKSELDLARQAYGQIGDSVRRAALLKEFPNLGK